MSTSTPNSSNRLAVSVAVVQFFFATTWTVYVVYLPQLVEQAGIAKGWVPWILLADQAVFAAADIATGFWVDRVRHGFALLGGWIVGVSVVSGAAFLLLPFTKNQPALLLGAILIWAVTSSALRAPPWALLGRHAAKPTVPWLSAIVLTGNALAGAAAPYLGNALRGVDPRLPFLISTLVLLATVAALVVAERKAPPEPEAQKHEDAPKRHLVHFFAAVLVLAIGFQIHFSLNSASLYLRFAKPSDLPWLMPVFWIGFNLVMFPASVLVKRHGAASLLGIAGVFGTLAFTASVLGENLNFLIAAQFIAGGCWGAASVAAYSAAIGFGKTGREGRFLGTLFAVTAVAAFARIGIAAAGLPADAQFRTVLAWLPPISWALAAVLVLAIARGFTASRPGPAQAR